MNRDDRIYEPEAQASGAVNSEEKAPGARAAGLFTFDFATLV